MKRALLVTILMLLNNGFASAKPLTPFAGAWADPKQTAGCDNAGIAGDGFTIENNVIGAGDTVCTIRHVDRRGETFFLRLHCHGLNRTMAGTRYARIERLSATRIRFNLRGETAHEYHRCPK